MRDDISYSNSSRAQQRLIFKVARPIRAKVNPVQEAFAKCFVVHLSEFKILQTKTKIKTKNIKMLNLLLKSEGLMFFVSFLK